jgi:hypothetical protein
MTINKQTLAKAVINLILPEYKPELYLVWVNANKELLQDESGNIVAMNKDRVTRIITRVGEIKEILDT